MTAIRQFMQKDLFKPDEERLVNVINVMKGGRKKKSYFLCLAVTNLPPVSVRLYQVKSDKPNVYRKKAFWWLRDIQQVDGINPKKTEFEMKIADKIYKWTSASVDEKDLFIKFIYKLSGRYLPVQKIDFANVSLPVGLPSTLDPQVSETSSQAEDENELYQPITPKEEGDFRHLLERCLMTIGQADQFYDHLTRELSVLDGANIQSIMGSEEAVVELMSVVDGALDEADKIETQLDGLDELLIYVRDSVELMEEKDSVTHVEISNRHKLMDELRKFVQVMDFSSEYEQILTAGELSDPTNINRCTRAAQALQQCMQAKEKIGTGLEKMSSCKERIKAFVKLSDSFSEKLVAHMTTLFQNLVDISEPAGKWHILSLPKHSQRHHALMPFAELVMWLKISRPEGYKALIDRYVAYTKELYKRDLDAFFGALDNELRGMMAPDRKSSMFVVRSPSTSLELNKSGEGSVAVGSESSVNLEKFQKLVETLLSEIDPVVMAEQKFCVRFFHISSEMLMAVETQSISSGDSGSTVASEKRIEKQTKDRVHNVLKNLFTPIDAHLETFLGHCYATNPFYVTILLVRLSTKALSIQDSSFIGVILGTMAIRVKRHFDTYMENETIRLADVKLNKKSRVGVLDSVSRFQDLASKAEAAFKGSERRADLDRWYPRLIKAISDGIDKAAIDPNSKSPPSVVRMENYHKLFSSLCELKIPVLDSERKTIKGKYQENLDIYVKEYMGRPLEKLQIFFDQVERCIQQGMKPEEVGYQQQFSKQELRRIIACYPGKEVRKGLDQLYRKVEKHLTSDSNLLQVVWRNMQDEFLQQLKHYDGLMGRCYPNSKIDLEFSIQDVLKYFSDFAQQH